MTDPKRATGRTTGLMLQAIGKAVQNPGTEIEFIDHHKQNHEQLQLYKTKIKLLAETLNLDVSVDLRLKKNLADFGLYVKSNWVSPYSQRTLVEEAYKDAYGKYPVKEVSENLTAEDNWNVISWSAFQEGYERAQQKEVKPFITNCVITGNPPDGYVSWSDWFIELGSKGILHNLRISSKNYEPTPQTPEQVADGLKEAFREAINQGVIPPVEKKQKKLTDLIERWWCDVFTIHSDWNMETSIDDLVDRIQLWLPKEQSAKGSQNAYVECSVDGFNDCVNKIKGNLR